MARYDLSETVWRLIEPLLPNKPRGVARVDDQRVINGIFYVLRMGSPWHNLPDRDGSHTTVYNRVNRWATRINSPVPRLSSWSPALAGSVAAPFTASGRRIGAELVGQGFDHLAGDQVRRQMLDDIRLLGQGGDD
ncbi:MAG: transposase [Phreatobacter sp.]|nr:transposase [Phreatobacter sp.]